MSNKKLIILGIIAACMVAWAIVQAHLSNRTGSVLKASAYLIQGLDPSNIDAISIGTGEKKTTLQRNGDRFVVANKDNYPAESGAVNNLISSCMDIKVEGLVTDNPSNHKDLGVTEEDADSVIKFLKQNSELLVGVIVGKDKGQGGGPFVRMVPGDRVYATLDRPWIKDQPMDYVDRNIVTVDRKEIESVIVSSSNGTYKLNPGEDGEGAILEDLPAGKELKANDANSVFTALSNLGFDDVMKNPAPDTTLTFDKKYVCVLKDSTLYTLKIAQNDDRIYVTCNASYTDKTPVTKERGVVESEEELKRKETKLLAREKVQNISARHNNWIYEIAGPDAKYLTKQLSELFEEVKKEDAGDE